MMPSIRPVRIAATGMFVPDRVISNKDLESMMDTTDEWIVQRSGIRERRWVEPWTTASDLGLEAARRALAVGNWQPGDIDLIIFATLSPDHYFPGAGVFLQHKLGLTNTPALDVRAQCSGMVYGLSVAQQYIATGQYKRILLVGAEVQSSAITKCTAGRDTAVLFGDGAAAMVLEESPDPERRILSCHLHAQGEFANRLWLDAPVNDGTVFMCQEYMDSGRLNAYMDGRFVFKHAVTRMPEVVKEALQHNNMTIADVDLFIFHQANLRINEYVAKSLEIPESKIFNNIEKYGNTSAASVGICLDECVRSDRIKKNDVVCVTTFGSGFTWGSAVIRW
jgi:3-oxoacyl-[acyl-carrier-protein] synthase-3